MLTHVLKYNCILSYLFVVTDYWLLSVLYRWNSLWQPAKAGCCKWSNINLFWKNVLLCSLLSR